MIYFAQPVGGGPVKIGCSDDVERRLKCLESQYRIPLSLLKVVPGGREEERAFHERFAAHRFPGTEQFRPVADLLEFLGVPILAGANPDTVEAMPERTGRGVSVKLPEWLVDQMREVTALEKTDIQSLCTDLLAPLIAERRREALRRALEGYELTTKPPAIPARKGRGRPPKGGGV